MSTPSLEERINLLEPNDPEDVIESSLLDQVNLDVPFYPQAPDGDWGEPWQEACEESSILLAHAYATGTSLSKDEFRQGVLDLVDWQNEMLGDYEHTTINQTARMFKEVLGFSDIKISIKSADVLTTVNGYRKLSKITEYPLHLGVTEAGGLIAGTVKSSVALGILLSEGIGDTFRISLTRDPVEEIRVGFEILRSLKIRERGPELISCPTCGRTRIDLFGLAEKVERYVQTMETPLKIAVMGCVVNGPGEAREADIGVAGGNGVGIIFKKGKIWKKVNEDELMDVFLGELKTREKEGNRACNIAHSCENESESRPEEVILSSSFQSTLQITVLYYSFS